MDSHVSFLADSLMRISIQIVPTIHPYTLYIHAILEFEQYGQMLSQHHTSHNIINASF